jgi:CDK inhibitor PHO81
MTSTAFRIYGHNYLDHKALVQVSLGHPNSTNGTISPAVRLYGPTQLSSLKLVMTPRPDLMAIPHSVILPLADEREVFAFQVSSFDAFTLDFDLFPTFGSRAVGKAVALPSLFAHLQNQSAYVLPLLDRHLKAIGEIAFELSVVRAFEGAKLDLGGGVETYWKATANRSSQQAQATPSIDIPALMSSAADAAAIAGPTLVTASSLTGQYVRVVVQVTRDGVPVGYPLWKLPVADLDVHVGDVTLEQFSALATRTGRRLDRETALRECADDPARWFAAIASSLVPLHELLEVRSFGMQQLGHVLIVAHRFCRAPSASTSTCGTRRCPTCNGYTSNTRSKSMPSSTLSSRRSMQARRPRRACTTRTAGSSFRPSIPSSAPP